MFLFFPIIYLSIYVIYVILLQLINWKVKTSSFLSLCTCIIVWERNVDLKYYFAIGNGERCGKKLIFSIILWISIILTISSLYFYWNLLDVRNRGCVVATFCHRIRVVRREFVRKEYANRGRNSWLEASFHEKDEDLILFEIC